MAVDYSTLVDQVGRWLARADLAAAVPDFIQLAEARIANDLRSRQMDSTQAGALVAYQAALPADFMEARAVVINVGGVDYSLEPESVTEATNQTFGTTPRNYRIGKSNLTTYGGQGTENYTLYYYAKIPALTTTNTTNWLMTAQPNIYLYACLLEAAPYLQDDTRTQLWGLGYTTALKGFMAADKMTRFRNARIRPTTVNP